MSKVHYSFLLEAQSISQPKATLSSISYTTSLKAQPATSTGRAISPHTGWKMLKKPEHVGRRKSSPRLVTPRTVRNIAIGEPRAKKLSGQKSSCG